MHTAPERYHTQTMVNRIDENNYYNYTKTKNVNIPDTGEKFSLNYGQDELQTDGKGKKDKADESEKSRKQAAEQNGVRLELSNRGKATSADSRGTAEAAGAKDAQSQQSIIEMIREIVTAAVSAVKDFFYKIWNEPDDKTETDAADSEQIAESMAIAESAAAPIEKQSEMPDAGTQNTAESQKMAEARLDREIQPYLRKGDLNQVISLLTDNGKKTVAMNSTLLTYYDRNGKMVEINASDRERILRGDRNTRKL